MPRRLSEWVTKARARWPRSHRAKEISGDGRFAVLTCGFFHPSAQRMCYSEVHLFATQEEATRFKQELDSGLGGVCHAATKNLCKGDHSMIDLATLRKAACRSD